MKNLILLLFLMLNMGIFAQEAPYTFESKGISFSGNNSHFSRNNQVIEFTGDVQFSTDIIEIEKADKIVYDRRNKTFTISGFKELRLHGKTKMASDFGSTTLRVEIGECVAYLKADASACQGKKGRDC